MGFILYYLDIYFTPRYMFLCVSCIELYILTENFFYWIGSLLFKRVYAFWKINQEITGFNPNLPICSVSAVSFPSERIIESQI